jgi:hypothetical protein
MSDNNNKKGTIDKSQTSNLLSQATILQGCQLSNDLYQYGASIDRYS